MKRADFSDASRFAPCASDQTLTEWALRGAPLVADTFIDPSTGACYQVCQNADLYRKTEIPDPAALTPLPYGEWLPLS